VKVELELMAGSGLALPEEESVHNVVSCLTVTSMPINRLQRTRAVESAASATADVSS
jgi:hypothetical protein